MKLLNTIYRDQIVTPNENTLERFAARAVIFIDGKLLLIKSRKYNEYKFPGGGIEENETKEDALIREVLEETGYSVIPSSLQTIGSIVEISKDKLGPYDFYQQTSYYYLCHVSNDQKNQSLTTSEKEYDYQVELVEVDVALVNNQSLEYHQGIRWNKRETWMLEYIKNNLL